MFELVENRLFASADDSPLLAVVRKATDRPAVADSLNRDLPGIQEWCNHWCVILNPNKTKALVVSISRTVSPPNGDLDFSVVSIWASPNLEILGAKFDSKLTIEDHVYGIFCFLCHSENWYFDFGEMYICVRLCYFIANLHSFSQSWSIVLQCEGQLLNVTFSFLSSRCIWRPGCVTIRVSCRCVIDFVWRGLLCCTILIRTLLNVCSASFHLLLLKFDILQLRPLHIHWSLKYQGVERPNLQGFPAGSGSIVEWPSLQCDWFRNAGWVLRYSQLLVSSLSCVFASFPWRRCLFGCESKL